MTCIQIIFTICIYTHYIAAENVQSKIYMTLDAVNPCILRLNGSQTFGCSSDRSGNAGALYVVDENENSSLRWILDTTVISNVIVAIPLNHFNMNTLLELDKKEHIKGVFVYQKNRSRKSLQSYSSEDRCPNRYSGLTSYTEDCESKPWNSVGNEIFMRRWNMPIFFSNDDFTINTIENYFKQYNTPVELMWFRRNDLCAMELSSHMWAGKDSTTCLRRNGNPYTAQSDQLSFCLPMVNKNLYVPAIPFNQYKNKSYIFVTARLDAKTLFYGKTPGSVSTATSIIALQLIVNRLKELLQKSNMKTFNKNVLFILYNGEAYDYIGSSRVVFDMEKGLFPFKENPISLSDIDLYIDLSQLLNKPDKIITVHTLQVNSSSTDPKPSVQTFCDKFKDFATNSSISLQKDNRLPPSSLQRFLARRDIDGFVMSSYTTNFRNQFYHSIYDDYVNAGIKINAKYLQKFLSTFSVIMARTLFNQMGGEDITPNEDESLASVMISCFLKGLNCEAISDDDSKGVPYHFLINYDVGVDSRGSTTTILAFKTFSFLSGTDVINATTPQQCEDQSVGELQTMWFSGPKKCKYVWVNVTQALSPAFMHDDYILDNGTFSSWTQSGWSDINVRLFLIPSKSYEIFVFTFGITISVGSFLIVYWIELNSKQLFNYLGLVESS